MPRTRPNQRPQIPTTRGGASGARPNQRPTTPAYRTAVVGPGARRGQRRRLRRRHDERGRRRGRGLPSRVPDLYGRGRDRRRHGADSCAIRRDDDVTASAVPQSVLDVLMEAPATWHGVLGTVVTDAGRLAALHDGRPAQLARVAAWLSYVAYQADAAGHDDELAGYLAAAAAVAVVE